MNDLWLRLYHRMPAWGRSLAASARGFQLERWRYGADSETLIGEAIEREQWDASKWHSWQQEKLTFLLHRAATEVPYYRELWAERRRKGDRSSWERLENWPILEKEALRRTPRAFVADSCDVGRMFHEHTSGTTGTPVQLWFSRDAVRLWYALHEARARLWNGVSRKDRWAMLGGQLVTPQARTRPPFWVWNVAMKQLYMSSYHLEPETVPVYVKALCRYRVRYIVGYTSSLYALSLGVMRHGLRPPKLAAVITNAEPVFDYQRAAISEAFQCPVRETYGMSETTAAATECAAGKLHLWPEAGVMEVLGDDGPAAFGSAGELICTGLCNSGMPLIRYRVGDRGAVPATGTCSCGRTLPVMASIEGRTDDILYGADGRSIGRLDPVFKSDLPIEEAQIVQEDLDRVRVVYVPAPGFDSRAERSIAEQLRRRMGPVRVEFEAVRRVPRTANGKFRAVVCRLSKEKIEALQGASRGRNA